MHLSLFSMFFDDCGDERRRARVQRRTRSPIIKSRSFSHAANSLHTGRSATCRCQRTTRRFLRDVVCVVARTWLGFGRRLGDGELALSIIFFSFFVCSPLFALVHSKRTPPLIQTHFIHSIHIIQFSNICSNSII